MLHNIVNKYLVMPKVYLMLGSNLGDSETYLYNARKKIAQEIGRLILCSKLYVTEAWGKTDQPDFINQVIVVESFLSPIDLLNQVLKIETGLGRERNEKWGARTIDIDVLFYDDWIVNDTRLTIPHPELHKRKFTLVPLNELIPDFIHPVFKKTIKMLYFELNDSLNIKLIN